MTPSNCARQTVKLQAWSLPPDERYGKSGNVCATRKVIKTDVGYILFRGLFYTAIYRINTNLYNLTDNGARKHTFQYRPILAPRKPSSIIRYCHPENVLEPTDTGTQITSIDWYWYAENVLVSTDTGTQKTFQYRPILVPRNVLVSTDTGTQKTF